MKLASQTDRLGKRTEWTYDIHGNTLTERTTGVGPTLNRAWSYEAPENFNPPFIKNRTRTETDARNIITLHSYDNRGRLLTRSRGGVTETWTYLANGDLQSISNGAGDTTTYEYNPQGLLASEFAPLGATRQHVYDARGRRINSTDERGFTTHWEYDAWDRQTRITDDIGERTITYGLRSVSERDERGNFGTVEFDGLDRMVRRVNAIGAVEEWRYDEVGNLLSETDPLERETTHTYNAASHRVRTQAPGGLTIDYVHDAEGHLLSETRAGAGGIRTLTQEFAHPSYQPTRMTRGGIATVIMEYDGNGNLLRQVDPRGFATIQEFDNRDRLVSRTEPESRSSTFTWDGADRQTLEQHSSGWRRTTEYNALGQPILVTDGEGKAISRVYDKRGNVLSQTDRRAAVVNWSYDARGRKETETGPVTGMQTVWTYDGTNNPVTETRANGQVLTHVYDAINRRTRSSDADGVIEDLEYDKANNLLQQTDANGRQTFYSYNDLNQRIQQTAPLGRISRMSPSVHGEVLTETMPTGGVTSHGYDALGRRTRTTFPQTPSDAAAPFATWNYDASGNVISARDPRGLVTISEFDGLNRRKKQTDPAPLSHQQLWTYDTAGNVLTHSDRNAVVTSYTYDTENRKKTTTRANSVRERLVYDGEGAVISRKDALERETVFELDKAGRVVETRLPENIVRKQRWSPLGDLLEVNDGTDRITKYTYDLRRRKITEANGANETMRYVYDAVGNLRFMAAPLFTGDLPTLTTDCIGGAPSYLTRYCYDAAHRLIAVSDPQRHRTQYEYDLNDNLIAVIEPRGNRSEFRYDVRNRRIEKKSPELSTGPPQVWSWTYDPNGNPLTQTDPVGTVSTHTYDVLNRRTATVFASAPPGSPSARNWTYDPNGNPTAISETRDGTTVSLSVTYDDFNRPTQLIDANARTWAQTWDAADQRKSLTSPDVPAVSWNYDNAGRAAQIIVEGAGTFTLGYDAADRNASINHPNGVQTTHSFDPAGRIAEIAHMRAGGTVARFQYQYDANGNRTTQIEENGGPAQTSTYTYDFADRLTAISEPGKHTTYTLDANSNRLETREGPSAGSVNKRLVSTFDARNQIRDQKEYNSANTLVATTNFEFDPNGNIARQTKAALVTEYQYDALDRLVAITPPTGPPASYRYGPSDVRIASVRGTEETRYHYDGERLILETNTLGNPQKHYAYSAAGLLNSALLGASPAHRSAHLDAQVSPVVLSLATGNVLSRSHFDPYGVETPIFGVRDQAISYQGYWSAPEFGSTDLLSAGRFYLPGLGAFGERDPVEGATNDPASFNAYLIGRSNPYRWPDPDGRCAGPAAPAAPVCVWVFETAVARVASSRSAAWLGRAIGGTVLAGAYLSATESNEYSSSDQSGLDWSGRGGYTSEPNMFGGGLASATGLPTTQLEEQLPHSLPNIPPALPQDKPHEIPELPRDTPHVMPELPDISKLPGTPLGEQEPQIYVSLPPEEQFQSVMTMSESVDSAAKKKEQLLKNAKQGAARHDLVVQELQEMFPSASIQSERYLRTSDGKRAIDSETEEARRIDLVAIENNVVVASVEVTSMDEDKTLQSEKEERIRKNGGVFIRDKKTRGLLDVSKVPTRIVRKE